MQEMARKNPRAVPRDPVQVRNAIFQACDIDTCNTAMTRHYPVVQKLARAWGSNVVAVMLFVGENWLRGRKDWFPVIVEKKQFAPGHRRYFMMFQPRQRILCDFSIDFCFGGVVSYDPEQQEALLQDALSDPTLRERLEAGMKNFGMKVSVDALLTTFVKALHEGRKHEPEKLFAKQEAGK